MSNGFDATILGNRSTPPWLPADHLPTWRPWALANLHQIDATGTVAADVSPSLETAHLSRPYCPTSPSGWPRSPPR
jgi:hypothetical protein